MGIQGEKVTYSCPTEENLFICCQAKRVQCLQTGHLLRASQQHSQSSPNWGILEGGGLRCWRCPSSGERGLLSRRTSFDKTLSNSRKKIALPKPSLLHFTGGFRSWGEVGKKRANSYGGFKIAFLSNSISLLGIFLLCTVDTLKILISFQAQIKDDAGWGEKEEEIELLFHLSYPQLNLFVVPTLIITAAAMRPPCCEFVSRPGS